jgi:hypothetical protein
MEITRATMIYNKCDMMVECRVQIKLKFLLLLKHTPATHRERENLDGVSHRQYCIWIHCTLREITQSMYKLLKGQFDLITKRKPIICQGCAAISFRVDKNLGSSPSHHGNILAVPDPL